MSGAAPVLVVDDDESARAFVSSVIERVGIPTQLAASGIEALELAAERRPAMVLLDVSMPGISGYETCHELRNRFGPSLPIVFLSGERVEPYDRAAGLLIGADDYLLKPVSQDELLARVRTLTARSEYEEIPLTPREREVIGLLADGLSGREIAEHLVIAPSTAAKHIEHAVGKLGVRSRTQAVVKAYRLRLI
ncbi:MAG: response regulator transcription factor [Thermoleophilia bacterium]|nr:response regulator transcription factor [Thermoleophilia bacterium]